jgi:hypothetical protein
MLQEQKKNFPTPTVMGDKIAMDESYPLPPRLAALLEDLPLERLAFAPVPVRRRSDGWTAERQRGFIVRLALGGCVARAARGVGMTKVSAYRLRERPGAESFAAAWERALGWGRSIAVDLGMERALCPEQVPVMYRGRQVGTRLRYDNGLLIAVLNAIDRPRATRASAEEAPVSLERALAMLDAEAAATEKQRFSPST